MKRQRPFKKIAGTRGEMSNYCCDIWPQIVPEFDWMMLPDGAFVMPHIDVSPNRAGGMMRVNYCPSCGAEVRSIQMPRSEVRG